MDSKCGMLMSPLGKDDYVYDVFMVLEIRASRSNGEKLFIKDYKYNCMIARRLACVWWYNLPVLCLCWFSTFLLNWVPTNIAYLPTLFPSQNWAFCVNSQRALFAKLRIHHNLSHKVLHYVCVPVHCSLHHQCFILTNSLWLCWSHRWCIIRKYFRSRDHWRIVGVCAISQLALV